MLYLRIFDLSIRTQNAAVSISLYSVKTDELVVYMVVNRTDADY